MRENYPSGTSGMDHVPTLMDEFSMIGVLNKRSAQERRTILIGNTVVHSLASSHQ